jgi:hypothetical protein
MREGCEFKYYHDKLYYERIKKKNNRNKDTTSQGTTKNKNIINAKTKQDVMDVNMLEVSYIIVNNKENAKW